MTVVSVPSPIYRGQRKHYLFIYLFICRFYASNIVPAWRWLACFTRDLPLVRFKNINSECLLMSICNNSTTDVLTLRFSPFRLPALFVTVTVIVESTSKQSAISRETRLKKNSTSTCGNADPIYECVTFHVPTDGVYASWRLQRRSWTRTASKCLHVHAMVHVAIKLISYDVIPGKLLTQLVFTSKLPNGLSLWNETKKFLRILKTKLELYDEVPGICVTDLCLCFNALHNWTSSSNALTHCSRYLTFTVAQRSVNC